MPGLAIAGDSVGSDQEFAHHCGQRHLAGPVVVVDEATIEVAERRGVTDGSAGGIEQRLAHRRAAITDRLLIAAFAAPAGAWCEADQSGDLLVREQSKLGQVGDQGGGDNAADPEDRLQQSIQLAAVGSGGDRDGDVGLDSIEAGAQHRDDLLETGANRLCPRHAQAAALGVQRRGELAPPARAAARRPTGSGATRPGSVGHR